MQLQIEKLVYGGDGLARLPADEHGRGKAVFVPFVLPGEDVEASVLQGRSGFVRAALDRVLVSSPERVEPSCPYFARCGGCHYQHIGYAAQLRHKAEILRETLRRTAKLDLQQDITLHSSEPWGYRNRTRMHVHHQPQFALGYFRHNSHALLPVENCPISSPLINRAITAVWTVGRRKGVVPESLHGLQFFANHDDTKLLVELYVRLEVAVSQQPPVGRSKTAAAGPDEVRASAKAMQTFATQLGTFLPELAGVGVFAASPVEDESRQHAPLTSTHSEAVQAIGEQSLMYHIVGADYRVSAGSFFQTNRFLIDKLIEIVVTNRTGRAALDLYAGAGLFTQRLARNFDQVLAVESSPHSFADLRHNVPANVKCIRSTTESFLAERSSKLALDLVILDPPRAGLGERAAAALGRMSASHATYVSCDPATLSRDLRVLLELGYRVEQAHLVDLFPQTYHMETVLHLAR
ncbi:MAG: class I SAM-dependent RNA methyltransferase [Candidatus Korobacteraceae bacterium]